MKIEALTNEIAERWSAKVHAIIRENGDSMRIDIRQEILVEMCGWLFHAKSFRFHGIVVEEGDFDWGLSYLFSAGDEPGWLAVLLRAPLSQTTFPSISGAVHAADVSGGA